MKHKSLLHAIHTRTWRSEVGGWNISRSWNQPENHMAPMFLSLCLLLIPLVVSAWDPRIIAEVDSDEALSSSGPLTRYGYADQAVSIRK